MLFQPAPSAQPLLTHHSHQQDHQHDRPPARPAQQQADVQVSEQEVLTWLNAQKDQQARPKEKDADEQKYQAMLTALAAQHKVCDRLSVCCVCAYVCVVVCACVCVHVCVCKFIDVCMFE
jgi:hypothetical protein